LVHATKTFTTQKTTTTREAQRILLREKSRH
jgi:hypothetical protein